MGFSYRFVFFALTLRVGLTTAQNTSEINDHQTSTDNNDFPTTTDFSDYLTETQTTNETLYAWASNESESRVDVNPNVQTWDWHPLRWTWYVIVHVVSSILGVTGNGIVMLVIYQRTATMKSTDTLIGALAFTDFLTSLFLFPVPGAKQIPATTMARVYCKILYTNVPLWLCISASTLFLVAICIERYIAVVYPLFFNRVISRRKVHASVLLIWFLSLIEVGHVFFTFDYDEGIHHCTSTIKSYVSQMTKAYSIFIVRLVIPTIIMLVTQILIARSLHRQARHFRDMLSGGNNAKKGVAPVPSFHLVARNRVIKMMLIVVIVFVVTWTPNQIAYLCFNLGYIPASYRGSPLHRALTVLGFVNSCVNPFIYAARNKTFRKAVKDLLTCARTSQTSLFDVRERSSSKAIRDFDDVPTSP